MPTVQPIAFFDLPDNTRITTTLAVAEGLAQQGHPLDYYCLEDSKLLVESVGANFCCLPSFKAKINGETLQYRVLEYTLDNVATLVGQLQASPPALIIFTGKCLWAAVLAECLDIPSVCIHTNYLLPRHYFPPFAVLTAGFPSGRRFTQWQWYRRDLKLWQALQQQYHLHKIHKADLFKWQPNCINLRGDLNLVYPAREFQDNLPDFDDSYHFIGPCYGERPFDDTPVPPASIYISLGSIKTYNKNADFYRKCIEAFASAPYQVVMSVGRGLDRTTLGNIPENVSVLDYVPQLDMLKQASLFITHGGTNSVWEALLEQVPMLLFPQGGDQHLVANRIQTLNLGQWVKPDISATNLRKLAEKTMHNPNARKSLQQMSKAFHQAGGTDKAITTIRNFLQQHETA
ncbi:MAG: Unknown protein [uncultured Thiotrichaceae bacterium]|uniref:Erythromycin biosynthesis protein CIII-like C-terminal domain-containing protein n=1 Tax=uncultured Thiotrichaceae bacterium TaxID=298394 RepID=A0A6S6TR06_9GAMM|nr:MAG: Unknown protein [uncultured Thiotrichaceae bacterium]